MGYRSDFQLIINTAGRAQEVMDWLRDYSNKPGDSNDFAKELVASAVDLLDDDTIIFSGDSWKLYGWEEFVDDLDDKYVQDEEVEIAYAVIGEDLEDMVVRCENNTYPYIVRSIGDADICQVPKKQRKLVTTPLDKPILFEEECGFCGKTKDAGQKCWWCGN